MSASQTIATGTWGQAYRPVDSRYRGSRGLLRYEFILFPIGGVSSRQESVLKGTDFEEVHMNAIAMECDEHVFNYSS